MTSCRICRRVRHVTALAALELRLLSRGVRVTCGICVVLLPQPVEDGGGLVDDVGVAGDDESNWPGGIGASKTMSENSSDDHRVDAQLVGDRRAVGIDGLGRFEPRYSMRYGNMSAWPTSSSTSCGMRSGICAFRDCCRHLQLLRRLVGLGLCFREDRGERSGFHWPTTAHTGTFVGSGVSGGVIASRMACGGRNVKFSLSEETSDGRPPV